MANPPDIVQRITQHIQSFQRSKVQLGEPREVVMPAARVGDIINHTSFWAALAGAVVGACVTAGIFALASAAVAAVGITGGLAAPIAGALLGGFATWAVSDGIEKVTSAVTEFVNEAIGGDPSGPIILGSPSVLVNNKPLALAQLPLSVGCTRHSPPPQIAQGSETVSANGKPVARKGDKTECSATIAEGSPNVFFGSGQGTYVDMKPEFTGFQRALLFVVEFVVPPTALFGKGIGKGLATLGKTLATKGPRAGAALAAKMAGKAAKGIAQNAANKAQNMAKAAKSVAKGAKAVTKSVAKGAKAVGKGIGKGVKQAGNIARGKTLGCAKAAFKDNSGRKRFTEATKKFFKGDPIDVFTGQVVEQRTDFTLGQTIPLAFIRTWSRHKDEQQADGLCGRFWTDNFSEYAEVSDSGQHIKIATFEGSYLRFALPLGATGSSNPDHPEYTLIRHREYLELFHRETQLSKLFYFSHTAENDDTETESAEADFAYPPLTDGRYLISAWLDTFDNAVQFHYNEHSWLEAVSHTDGITLAFTYQGEWLHQIIRTDTEQAEILATYHQDERGALVESNALLDFHLFYEYDSHFNLTRWADNDKTWVDYHYDEQGRVIHSIGAEGFYPVWFQYEENRTTVLDSQQRATVYDYDSHIMKPLSITLPSGAKTHFEYDRYGNLLSQTFADGKQVQFDYLEQTGLVTCFTDTAGKQWHYDYDENEQLCQLSDPLGRVWAKTENRGAFAKNSDNPTAYTTLFTAPDGSTTEFIRNQYGLLTEINSTLGKHQQTEQFRYDPRHRLVEAQDAEQRRIQLGYDDKDRFNRLTNARGKQWHYGYNAHHKLTHIARPNQSEEKHHYDRHGNLIRYTDANGVDWQLKYGAFDLLTEKVDGEGNRWLYDYDKDSLKLNKVTNPKGETYTYTFNENGQVVEETDFADNRWRYTYNDNGTLQSLTDGEGNVAHYEYDNAGNLIRLMTADDSIVYRYDDVGRVTDIQSIDQQLHFEYDVLDRIVKETQNHGEIHRTYDDEHQTLTRTLFIKDEQGQLNTPSPIITTFKYNQVGELIQLDLPETSGQKHTLFFQYDQNGNEIHRTSHQGFILNQRFDEMDCLVQQRAGWEPEQFFDKDELRATGIDAPSFAEVNKSYRYDNALNTIETKDKGEQLYFTLNKNNQITAVHNQNREQERYAYDSCGYLTQQAQAEYGFTRDELNPEYQQQRLIQHSDIYQQGHKLNRLNHHYYRYDNAGRLTEKTEIRDGFRQKTTYYRWNANNQLTGITNDKGEVWYYKYDALGRRISKECPQQHLSIEYLWDGDQLAYTQTFKNGKLDSQRHSVFNGWQLLAQQDSYQQIKQTIDGNLVEWRLETGYAVCQPNGQVLALLNPKGRTLWRKEKQTLWGLCFANEYKQPNPLDPQLLFAGQWVDEESGLVYNRFRYYDPESGNYISSDPIGLNGGETPYSYVHNVLDFLDPFGLAKCPKLPSTDGGLSQVQKNKKIGDKVRDEIARERGVITVEKVMKTSSGKIRRIDVYDDIHGAKIGIESKVGRTSLTSRTRQELARDITLMREGKLDGIEWVFTRSPITGKIGPTAALESKLNKFGIPIIYR